MREQFEREIQDDPDDLNRYAVYADWLMDQGDPRGEFMQIQLLLERGDLPTAERAKLKEREEQLLNQHFREWTGRLADKLSIKMERATRHKWNHCTFARGMLDVVLFPKYDRRVLSLLANSPQGRFLRQLVIEYMSYQDEARKPESINFPNVRVLRWGEGGSGCNGEGIVELIHGLPRLEELVLEAHAVDTHQLFDLSMPCLRQLTVHHLTDYFVEQLAENPTLTKLELISFHPHAVEPGEDEACLRLEHVQAIARSPYLKNLRHLELHACSMGDEGCTELVESGLLGRLRVLDLSHGRVSDAGAAQLAQSPHLSKLERLALTHNCLTDAGIRQLQETGVNLEATEQWEMTGGDGDDEYLYSGDWE